MASQRSLNVPLFSDEDFSKVEQDVREAMALKARDTSLTITSAPSKAPAARSAEPPVFRHETPLSSEAALDVEGILTKILHGKSGVETAAIAPDKVDEVVLSVAPEREDSPTEIPGFLRRGQPAPVVEAPKIAEPAYTSQKGGISWKLPYAIVGALVSGASMVTGFGYAELFIALTMVPLIDPTFYKK